jgi:hypothetical protein
LNGNIIFFVHALVHKLQKHHINNFIPNSKLRRFNATPTNHRALHLQPPIDKELFGEDETCARESVASKPREGYEVCT